MKNIRHDRYGTQAYFKHDGKFIQHRWKASEHPDVRDREDLARQWLRNARAYAQLKQPIPEQKGPRFEQDVDAYLEAVTSMPSYADRKRDMQRWASAFKGRERNSITPLEIRTQLEKWRSTHAASTCNKRRTALMSFYTRLNGRSGYNPVRDVEKYPEDNDEPRAQHPFTIYRILALMAPSKTRARLRVILTTGWPHAQVKRLKPEHLDLKNARAFVTPRRKGKGRKGGWLPLLPSAVDALREFQQWDAFTTIGSNGKPQPFSNSAMHSAFKRAVAKLNAHRKRLGLPALRIRPYDLRHSFGTWLAHRMTDERALQELMMHSRIEQTRRYTHAATAGRIERALAGLATSSNTDPKNEGIQTGYNGEKRQRKDQQNRQKVARARQVSNLRPPA